MNIKEAYAKATPGPMLAVNDVMHVYNLETRTHPHRADKRCIVAGMLIREDAALLAHAYNVLPEVLEEGSALLARLDDLLPAMDEFHRGAMSADIEAYRAIIAKASEVKI